jgi:hypothetical protein
MHGKARNLARLLALFAVASILACAFHASFSASVSFRISTKAQVFSSTATERAEVSPSEVRVPAESVKELNIQPGAILVSEDFVRRVVTTQTVDGTVVAQTEPASLEEAIEQGEWATEYDLGSDPVVTENWATASPKALWSGKGFEVTLERRSILLDSATNARVWLDGSLSFKPRLDLKLQFGPTYAHAIARGALDASLNVTATASTKRAYEKSVLLWESPPFSVPLGWIGPVPIKFQAKLAVRAILSVSASGKITVNTGFTFHADGGYGFRYQSGTLAAVKEWNATGEVKPPSVTATESFDIHAGLRAEIDGGLNGDVWVASATGGLRLNAEAYAEAHVDPTTWNAKIGVKASALAYLRVVALFWSKEWQTNPVTIMDRTLLEWGAPTATPSVTAACSKTSTLVCGPSLDPVACRKCGAGEACVVGSDCTSSFCWGGYCFGGSTEGTKKAGDSCTTDASCVAGLTCNVEIQPDKQAAQYCRADTCGDEKSDGDESDLDCGGSCRPCFVGRACHAPSDCASGVCRGNACAAR